MDVFHDYLFKLCGQKTIFLSGRVSMVESSANWQFVVSAMVNYFKNFKFKKSSFSLPLFLLIVSINVKPTEALFGRRSGSRSGSGAAGQLKMKEIIPSNEFWGPSHLKSGPEDTKIYPFEIKIPDKILGDLESKLEEELNSLEDRLTPPPLEGVDGFEYGMNTKYLKKVLKYWQKDYDWRERESTLNKWPHFKTKIAGLDIHFQHAKAPSIDLYVNGSLSPKKYRETRPLLMMHGWPGSFVEFQNVLPNLLEPDDSDYNFEVIIPSLPGYAFSEASHRPGLGPADLAPIFLKLMQRLGFQKFYIQAGDFGSIIATHMATVYPQNIIAFHSNMCTSTHPLAFVRLFIASLFPSFFMSAKEIQKYLPLTNYLQFIIRETGHFHIQATKPDTIGLALSMTPSGLAAYILEKFSTWTNIAWMHREDGGLPQSGFSMDQLLDNIMIYYCTNSVTTSVRLYVELLGSRESSYGLNNIPVQIPVACLVGGKDSYAVQSKWVLQDKFPNLVSYTLTDVGGHFFSMEQPDMMAQDFLKFVKLLDMKKVAKS